MVFFSDAKLYVRDMRITLLVQSHILRPQMFRYYSSKSDSTLRGISAVRWWIVGVTSETPLDPLDPWSARIRFHQICLQCCFHHRRCLNREECGQSTAHGPVKKMRRSYLNFAHVNHFHLTVFVAFDFFFPNNLTHGSGRIFSLPLTSQSLQPHSPLNTHLSNCRLPDPVRPLVRVCQWRSPA